MRACSRVGGCVGERFGFSLPSKGGMAVCCHRCSRVRSPAATTIMFSCACLPPPSSFPPSTRRARQHAAPPSSAPPGNATTPQRGPGIVGRAAAAAPELARVDPPVGVGRGERRQEGFPRRVFLGPQPAVVLRGVGGWRQQGGRGEAVVDGSVFRSRRGGNSRAR